MHYTQKYLSLNNYILIMKKTIRALSPALVIIALIFQSSGWSQDREEGAYLDPRYPQHFHPRKSLSRINSFELRPFDLRALNSDTRGLIAKQSSVKAQGMRGTCSIFSATALFESMLIIVRNLSTQIDYSEEWLEYLVTRNSQSDGSTSWANFSALFKYGTPDELVLPYIGETWDSVGTSVASKLRCQNVPSNLQKSCLVAHRDPRLLAANDSELSNRSGPLFDLEFLNARKAASEMREKYLAHTNERFSVPSTQAIKQLLDQGIPVTLDIDFYYGAWNHRKTTELGITRNMDHWHQGIVGYPEQGSLDRKKSLEDPAGHSVVIVGYDDDIEVTTQIQMANGSTQTFKHKGIYYFKNSWGTESFGKDFLLDHVRFPGYGMITQDYAEDFGSFFKIELTR